MRREGVPTFKLRSTISPLQIALGPQAAQTQPTRRDHGFDQRDPCPRPARKHDRRVGRGVESRSGDTHARSHPALAAVDAPPVSYLLNLGAASEIGIDAEQVRGVLAGIAPIIGTARVASATGKIVDAIEVAIEVAELEEEEQGEG
jgi:hypothetical protein